MTADSHALAVPEEHSAVAGLSHDTRGGISNPILGDDACSSARGDVLLGLFAGLLPVRASGAAWPPIVSGGTPIAKELQEAFDLHKEPWFAAILTIILILSSFTCQFAVWSIRRDDRTGFVRNIGITLVLGIVFLIGQLYDYATLGFGISDGVFGTTFYTLTGFHGAHVFGGAIMLSVVLYRGLAGQFSSRHHDAVEATSLYWHFVDVVWIALFSTLYIL
jgi:cytochrome c oxidase subunit 3